MCFYVLNLSVSVIHLLDIHLVALSISVCSLVVTDWLKSRLQSVLTLKLSYQTLVHLFTLTCISVVSTEQINALVISAFPQQ